MVTGQGIPLRKIEVSAFTVPTSSPEGDGTLRWDSTTMVLAEAHAGDIRGLGYTYAHSAVAAIIRDTLAPLLIGRDVMDVSGCWAEMVRAVRNIGRAGVCSEAISAVDAALWDLKARLLGLPLVKLLGQVRESVPLYFSGGFTTYSVEELTRQLRERAAEGFQRLKMKVGSEPAKDLERVRAAREAIGPDAELFIDANGAYTRKQALHLAERVAPVAVTWFEEPVSSDDLPGLRLLRDRAPAGMNIAAGEYGYDAGYFRRMLESGAVDVLQADATRCAGITGFLQVDALCEGFGVPLSAHTAPALHLHVCAAAGRLVHLEYFHDHVRVEGMLFDGALDPEAGHLRPDSSRPGLGLEPKRADAEEYSA